MFPLPFLSALAYNCQGAAEETYARTILKCPQVIRHLSHHTLSMPAMQDLQRENSSLLQAVRQARTVLGKAARQLNEIIGDEVLLSETPIEVSTAMECAAEDITAALHSLESVLPATKPAPPSPGAPTRQQGQFLAYIREYTMRNYAGVAPTHAALQRFFNLTPPSVNSMLIRLERRGFIRRVPHQARGIELTIDPSLIPPLDRPFKT
jgi:repressor LexA